MSSQRAYNEAIDFAQNTFQRNVDGSLKYEIYDTLLHCLDYTEIKHAQKRLEFSPNPKLHKAIEDKKEYIRREQYLGEDFTRRRLFKKQYVKIHDFDISWVLKQLQEKYTMNDLESIPHWEDLSIQQKTEIETEYWKGISQVIFKTIEYIVSSQKIKHDLLRRLKWESEKA